MSNLKLVSASAAAETSVVEGEHDSMNDTANENYENIRDKDVKIPERLRFGPKCLNGELDTLLGGKDRPGILVGGSYLITGEQNSGKTTGTMQMADALQGQGHTVMYNSQEMIESEMKMMMERLELTNGFGLRASDTGLTEVDDIDSAVMDILSGMDSGGMTPDMMLMKDYIDTLKLRKTEREQNNNDPEKVADALRRWEIRESQRIHRPEIPALPKVPDLGRVILFVDSIQALTEGRGAALDVLKRFIKLTQLMGGVVMMIGQVTKNGTFAGYNEMPHLVTTHLHLSVVSNTEGDQTRCWEAKKNRAGPCNYIYTQLDKNGHRYIHHREVEE